MNGEEQPFKRRRVTSLMMLPDDLLFNCLARVSRLDYPTLSLVSKRFRSLLASTELYQTRTLLGRTESCLYVCLSLSFDSNPRRWFTLGRRPHSSKKILVPISSLNFPSVTVSDVVVVGPNIYAIGGLRMDNDATASSTVRIMDCRSHKWCEAPSMGLAREFVFQSGCVLDGKIYVAGGCENLDSTNWMEVFDIKTQTWEFLQIPSEEMICGGTDDYNSVRYEGTIYVRSVETGVTYKLHKGRWRAADLALNYGWGSSYCVIQNVFFRYLLRSIEWYDSKEKLWKPLKGLETLFPRLSGEVKLTDYGGKMLVLSREHVASLIRCAEIAIEKPQKGEIRGTLEWFDVVYTTSEPVFIVEHALTTTI